MMGADAGGELVGVAYANDRSEAEMIQSLLESAGIPSALQPVGVDGVGLGFGWLNPGGGSRRVMVRASQSEKAQALLAEALVAGEHEDPTEIATATYPGEAEGPQPRGYGLIGAYARIWAWSLAALVLAFGVFTLLRLL